MSLKRKNPLKNQIAKQKLSRFPIFADLTSDQLQRVEDILIENEFNEGEEITKEGERGEELFVLLHGSVEVSKSLTLMVGRGDVDTRDKSLIQLRSENAPYFGEMAVLRKGSRRSATVKALESCSVGIIRRKDLIALCESDKEIGYIVLRNIAVDLAERLEKANQDILKLTTAFSLALQS